MANAGDGGASGPWLAVAVLLCVGTLNYVDRALPAILAEPIRRDLLLSDTSLGLINGFGFLLIYAFAGLPIARFADRGHYGRVVSGALAVWSAMTLFGGMAMTGWQLAATRMGVAVGEAGSAPAAHAFISRFFPPGRRAIAFALLTLSVPLGGACGLMLGGVLERQYGWRNTFMIMGLVGLVLVPLVLLTVRGESQAGVVRNARGAGMAPFLRKRSLLLIFAGAAFVAIGGYASSAFVPSFLMRVHGLSVATVGVQLGLATGLVGVVGLLLTGWLADRSTAQDERGPLRIVAAMIVVVLPASVGAFMVEDSRLALVLVAGASVVPVAYLAPVVATVHRLVPASHRAQASAALLFATGVLGGLGPLAVGLVSDALHEARGSASIAFAMMVVPISYALAAAAFAGASRFVPRELASTGDAPVSPPATSHQ